MEDELFATDGATGGDRLRSAVLHQLPGLVIAVTGPDHEIAALNQTYLDLLGGFNPVGLKAVDVFAGAEDQGILEMYDRALLGEVVSGQRVRFAIVTPEAVEQEVFLDFDVTPLRDARGVVVGGIGSGRDVTAEVRRERAEAAARAELARRFQRARDVIEEVQRALLPSRLPVLPDLEVAASYVVGGVEEAAGGDWFEIVPRGEGSVAAVVGDVVGHGVDASAVMAQLRAVTLQRLHAGASVTEAVQSLDLFVDVAPHGRFATVCVIDLHPATGRFRLCSAGHPPPLVVDVEGESHFLDVGDGGPIGTQDERSALSGVLAPEQLLLLYTDGIVERPGVAAPAGMVDLLQLATEAAADRLMPAFSEAAAVDRVAIQTLERATRHSGSSDDITMLALQRRPRTPDLDLELDTDRPHLRWAGAQVRDWLGPDRVAPEALDRLHLVLAELLENCRDHAYGGRPGPVSLHLSLEERGTVTLVVRDRGAWRPAPLPESGRGLGLALVQRLAEDLHVAPSASGTTVTVEVAPWKLSTGAQARTPRAAEELFDAYVQPHDCQTDMFVRGRVDAGALDELTACLALATTPGSEPLHVDLDDVTVLTSAAIRALLIGLGHAESAGVPTTIIASPGTIAHQVLTVAGIPTHPRGPGPETPPPARSAGEDGPRPR